MEEILIIGIYCVQPEFMTVITVQTDKNQTERSYLKAIPQMMQPPMTRGTHFLKRQQILLFLIQKINLIYNLPDGNEDLFQCKRQTFFASSKPGLMSFTFMYRQKP